MKSSHNAADRIACADPGDTEHQQQIAAPADGTMNRRCDSGLCTNSNVIRITDASTMTLPNGRARSQVEQEREYQQQQQEQEQKRE